MGSARRCSAHDEQVRVTGDLLVHQRRRQVDRRRSRPCAPRPSSSVAPSTPTSTTASTTSSTSAIPTRDLGVDDAAAVALGDWFWLATSVFDQFRDEWASADPSPAQLWPEHFDLAFDLAVGEPDRHGSGSTSAHRQATPATPTPTSTSVRGPTTARATPTTGTPSFGADARPRRRGRPPAARPAQRDRVLDFLRTGVERLRGG